jgi:hypothetical protein
VRNIEQLPRVCSVIFLWGGGDRGLRSRLYNQKTGAVMPSLLSIFYRAKHHKISEQPLDSEILGNLDKASKHFIVKWVVHRYEALPVEVENDVPQDLDELVSSRQERLFEMRLKYPNTPPMGFSSLTARTSKCDAGSSPPAPNSNRPVRRPPGPPMTVGKTCQPGPHPDN